MKVMILKTDDRLGIAKGEVYEAHRYHLDPFEKVSLENRVPDGYEPGCNEYIDNVAFMIKGEWYMVINGTYTIMDPQPEEKQ